MNLFLSFYLIPYPFVRNITLFADKAYCDQSWSKEP